MEYCKLGTEACLEQKVKEEQEWHARIKYIDGRMIMPDTPPPSPCPFLHRKE